MNIALLLLAGLVWIALVFVTALRPRHAELSDSELSRRSARGDQDAARALEREVLLPRVVALKRIKEVGLLVVLVLVAVAAAGWFFGSLLAVAAGLLVAPLAKSRAVCGFVGKLYDRYEPRLLEMVRRWKWLRFVAELPSAQTVEVGSKEDLLDIAERARGILTRDELTTIRSILTIDGKKISDVMTPRSVIDSIRADDVMGPLVLDQLHKTGHSRFPVIEGDIDHVIGILYLHDLIDLKHANGSAREVMQAKVHYIRQDQSLEHALHAFLRTHHHMFVVVNEFRETVGLLSLEDVLENILGRKIVDEFDAFDDLRAVATHNPRSNNQPKGKHDV